MPPRAVALIVRRRPLPSTPDIAAFASAHYGHGAYAYDKAEAYLGVLAGWRAEHAASLSFTLTVGALLDTGP